MSCVMCHVSRVTCHMSHVTCIFLIFLIFIFFYHSTKKYIGPMIRIGREIQCLPYAGFFFFIEMCLLQVLDPVVLNTTLVLLVSDP